MKTTVLGNIFTKSFMGKDSNNEEVYKNKVTVDLVNISWEFPGKEWEEPRTFDVNKIRLTSAKLDYKTGEVKHKAIEGKNGNKPYTRPDSTEINIEISQFKELLWSITLWDVDDKVEEAGIIE